MQDDRLIDTPNAIALLDSPDEIRAFWEQAQDEALDGMLASQALSSEYRRHAAQFRRAMIQLRALRKLSAPGAVPSPPPPPSTLPHRGLPSLPLKETGHEDA